MNADHERNYFSPSFRVSLASLYPSVSPSLRPLSSQFITPTRALPASQRNLAWISLQGRLIGVEDATSVRTIGGGFTPHQAVAWELFAPIHRVLIVALVAVATSRCQKNKQILQLRNSVHLRDQVLSSMQQKLDDLCEQLNSKKDQTESGCTFPFNIKNDKLCCPTDVKMNCGATTFSGGDGTFMNQTLPVNTVVDHEERRMSDLSDWASSSIASLSEIQANTSEFEDYILNLKRETQEKDATITKLSSFIQSSNIDDSRPRITELKDIIRRKNLIITKYKKDMAVLEQKVVQLTRQCRPSSSSSSIDTVKLPFMVENIIYDMDSTSSSSSDADCPLKTQQHNPNTALQVRQVCSRTNLNSGTQTPMARIKEIQAQKTKCSSKGNDLRRSVDLEIESHSSSSHPLKEKSLNQRDESVGCRRQMDSCAPKTRKKCPTSKDRIINRKWI